MQIGWHVVRASAAPPNAHVCEGMARQRMPLASSCMMGHSGKHAEVFRGVPSRTTFVWHGRSHQLLSHLSGQFWGGGGGGLLQQRRSPPPSMRQGQRLMQRRFRSWGCMPLMWCVLPPP